MRSRYPTPSIFNLSMVDVLFCILGCFTLLWMWKLAQGQEKDEQLFSRDKEVQRLLAAERTKDDQNKELRADLERRTKEIELLRDELVRSGTSLEEFRKLLALNEKQRKELETQVADLEKRRKEVEGFLADKEREYKLSKKESEDLAEKLKKLEGLLAKVEARAAMVTGLEQDVTKTRGQLDNEKKKASDLAADIDRRVKELTELTAKLERLEKALSAMQIESKSTSGLLATAQKKGIDLQKLLDDKLKELEQAQRQRDQWQALSENRFAGIHLTGKRVVFLLDMSGSMELLSEKEPAPGKWEGVQKTLVELLKSMPKLEKFQVIGFSDKTRYLMGGNGQWVDFDHKKSPDELARELARDANKPKDGTNMYAALEMAFKMRSQGMDTIYVLSDGLPNLGPGLTNEEERTWTESQKSQKLGRVVRDELKKNWNVPDKGQRVQVNAVGFYFESPDLGAFLWALSRDNDGNFVGMSKP